MSLGSDLVIRLKALLFRRRMERELQEEVEAHLAFETDARCRDGMSTDAARRQALVAFGGVERWKEATRDARGLALLDGLGLDLRQSLRALRRNPGFTAAVVLVLGLAIGTTTAVFTLVRTVVLSQLPYPAAERLVRVYQQNSPENRFGLSTVDVQAIEREQHVFDAFGAAQRAEVALSGTGAPERVVVGRVTPGFFAALGVVAAAGRLIQGEDLSSGAPPVAVVSWRFAERSLGGVDRAVGRAITLDGVAHTVIGVLPARSTDLAGIRAVAWPALRLQPPTRRGPFWLRGIGRLHEGVTLEAAANDLAGISARIFPEWASSFRDQSARLTPYPLRRTIVGDAGRGLELLAGAVALVLLVAAANVATLMLVRGSAREPELAVRTALGAGRGQLIRLLVSESAWLTLGSLLTAVAVAAGCLELLRRTGGDLPRLEEVALDGQALGLAVALACVAGILVSLSPVARLLPARPRRLRSVRGGTDRGTSRLRSILVVSEFALALPLLFGAGLLLTSFLRLSQVDPGFRADGVAAVNLALPRLRYPDEASSQAFFRRAEARLRELPGVTAVGLSTALPPDDPGDVNNFDLLDRPVSEGTAEPVAAWSAVTPGFFETLGVPLLDGRLFTFEDTASTAPVAVVSSGWARKYYGNESAIGRRLYSGGCRTCPPTTVIGVVGDVKYLGLSASAEAVYEPVVQAGPSRMNLLVRTTLPDAGIFPALRSALGGLDPELPLEPVLLRDRLRDSLSDPRRWMSLVTGFALAASLLAALGIYGLMAYLVRQRYREIGVRMALGAEPGRVTAEMMRRGMVFALAGSTIGVGLALAAGRYMGPLLFGVGPRDPRLLAAVVAVILAAALVSCWIPSRRAARIDLSAALRSGE